MSEILINQLFAGAYLQEGTNIGHEVINLFRDDNDQNNLFITPSGMVEGHEVNKVLFVQNIKARNTMEVILKAEGLDTLSEEEIQRVYYAGVSIEEIFRKNTFHGKNDAAGIGTMVTYRAANVRFPKKGIRIIITVDPNYTDEDEKAKVILLDPDKKQIVGQGMRTYVSEQQYGKIYAEVEKIMADETLWEDCNSTQKMVPEGTQSRMNISFLEIIRKENDEIIMSNLLAYYFNYNHRLFAEFTRSVLGIDGFGLTFEILREYKNVDLWIRGENDVLVIENKIKSGINGKTQDGKNQLNKYYEFAKSEAEDNGIENVRFFLFLPNYSKITIDDPDMREKYKVIYYSDIYDFFRENAAEYIGDKYFPDFLSGLRNHTMTFSELRFSIMRSRFLEKINQR